MRAARAQAHPFLRREVRTGPALLNRVTAAFVLRDRGEDVSDAMFAEWERPAMDIPALRPRSFEAGTHQLIVFLVTTRAPGAIRALGQDLAARPVHIRALVAQALGRGTLLYAYTGAHGRLRATLDPRGALDDGREDVLLALLSDRAVVEPLYAPRIWRGTGTTARTLALRVADLAAGGSRPGD